MIAPKANPLQPRSSDIPAGTCLCGCGEKTLIASISLTKRGWVKGKPRPYIAGHHMRTLPYGYLLIDRGHKTKCWIWQGPVSRMGYARIAPHWGVVGHRAVYEHLRGPIPRRLVLDHLCRQHACINPDHLEPVTSAQNSRRGIRTRLTVADVQSIRHDRLAGVSPALLATRWGVSRDHIYSITKGKAWAEEAE